MEGTKKAKRKVIQMEKNYVSLRKVTLAMAAGVCSEATQGKRKSARAS